jgi:hypothetical protein
MNAELTYLTEVLGIQNVIAESATLWFVTPSKDPAGLEMLKKMAQALGCPDFQVTETLPTAPNARWIVFSESHHPDTTQCLYAPAIEKLLGSSPEVSSMKRELWGRMKVWFSR